MRRVAFVINPVGIRHLRALERHCAEAAARSGWKPEVIGTEAGESQDELVRHLHRYAAGPGDRLVFAIGGDGTVQTCADALAYSGTALAIVPRGTANLFARALKVPSGLDAALELGFGPAQRWVDLASCGGSAFAAMAGIGLDAAVVRSTPAAVERASGVGGVRGRGRGPPGSPAERVQRVPRRRGADYPAGTLGRGRQRRHIARRVLHPAGRFDR